MQNLYDEMIEALRAKSKELFDSEDKPLKHIIAEKGLNLDPLILETILENENLKNHFTKEMSGTNVFDKVKFQKFINNKKYLQDSYTQFLNKIGLADGDGEIISKKSEVSLVWPHKDCVLQGGQTKDDDKRNEIFYNEILAPDDINRLFEPKALTNFKLYDKNGEKKIDIENAGNITENNLIIKGNNLLALHSLKKTHKGKVKLIYIDPPYNTGSDGFNYNDSFRHATWLTFMKNRLNVVKNNLLNDTGIIFISCDDRENAYLKVLCDSIFSRENFITQFIWRKKAGGGNDSSDIAVEHEYILAYKKKYNGIFKLPLKEHTKKNYKYKDEKYNVYGNYCLKDLNDPSISDSSGLHYDIVCPDGSILKGNENQWKCNKETFKIRLNDNRIVFQRNKKKEWKVYYKIYINEQNGKLNIDKDGNIIQKGRNLSSILYDVALNKEGNNDIKEIFDGQYPFNYPKPVNLLKTLIKVATQSDDIILDFFAGSGTTAQAVLELNKEDGGNRKFILCEQMDYIETVTVERVKKVIEKNGEGSFIYCELKKQNEEWLEKIRDAESKEELLAIWNTLKGSEYLSYKVNVDSIKKDETEIHNLSFEELKHFLSLVLDKNALYVNYKDIDDQLLGISEEEKILNKKFYEGGK